MNFFRRITTSFRSKSALISPHVKSVSVALIFCAALLLSLSAMQRFSNQQMVESTAALMQSTVSEDSAAGKAAAKSEVPSDKHLFDTEIERSAEPSNAADTAAVHTGNQTSVAGKSVLNIASEGSASKIGDAGEVLEDAARFAR